MNIQNFKISFFFFLNELSEKKKISSFGNLEVISLALEHLQLFPVEVLQSVDSGTLERINTV